MQSSTEIIKLLGIIDTLLAISVHIKRLVSSLEILSLPMPHHVLGHHKILAWLHIVPLDASIISRLPWLK